MSILAASLLRYGRRLQRAAVVLAGLCLLLSLLGRWRASERRYAATAWVKHTSDVQLLLAVTRRHLDAARWAAEKGAPSEVGALRRDIQELGELTADNAAQRSRTTQLVALVGGARFADMHVLLDEMSAEELRLKEERLRDERTAEWRGDRLIAVSAVLGVGLLVVLLYVERRSARIAASSARAVRASEERLRHITEHVTDLVWVHTVHGERTYVSPSCEALLGHTPEELLNGAKITHPEDASAIQAAIASAVARPTQQVELSHRLLTRSGEYLWFNSRLRVSLDEDGRPNALHTVSRDETRRRRADEELRAAKNAAEAAARSKSDFLARMSHEIRTPMNGVLGMTELVLQTSLTAEQREYITTARASAAGLLEIIEAVLDFSSVEAGKLRLEATRFGLRSSLGRALRPLAARAEEKGLSLLLRFEDDVPDSVVGDARRLAQILVNLVANAIKFTDSGEIVVRVAVAETDHSRARLSFSVEDPGIGIHEDKLGHIFEAFAQAEESTTRAFGGTGLGLAICRQLVSMMNGEIDVVSRLGQGSVFRFRVDVADPTLHCPDSRLPTSIRGARVLIVDPSSRSHAILHELLGSWGAECEVFSDFERAGVRALEQRRAHRGFDLVLVDGDLDAACATSLCRMAGPARLPLLVVGAPFAGADEQRSGWVARPVTASDLLETVEALLGGPVRATPPPALNIARVPRRVLVAEDNAVNRKVATAILERAGHRVVTAANGRLALAALAQERFDVVLMDVQMPEMDGLEATRRIRAREASRGGHIPIVALTAQTMRGDEELCLASGMDAYVRKPLSSAHIIEVIDAVTARPGAVEPRSAAPAARASLPMDRAALLEELGDPSLVAEVVGMYLADAPELLRKVDSAVAGNDGGALARAAHELKGTLANMRCGPAARIAADIEGHGRLGDVLAAAARLPALREELTAIECSLQHEFGRGPVVGSVSRCPPP